MRRVMVGRARSIRFLSFDPPDAQSLNAFLDSGFGSDADAKLFGAGVHGAAGFEAGGEKTLAYGELTDGPFGRRAVAFFAAIGPGHALVDGHDVVDAIAAHDADQAGELVGHFTSTGGRLRRAGPAQDAQVFRRQGVALAHVSSAA